MKDCSEIKHQLNLKMNDNGEIELINLIGYTDGRFSSQAIMGKSICML